MNDHDPKMSRYPIESVGAHPPYLTEQYLFTKKRAPKRPLHVIPQTPTELTGPVFGHSTPLETDADLTRQHEAMPFGERIVVRGRVIDESGRGIPNTLVEIWQANASGRYIHKHDQHDAPMDPNFSGAGRVVTDENGHYRFTTIRPGAYPVGGLNNIWRPAHIHMSLFGPTFLTRLVTQMYFPNDPLLAFDMIYTAAPEYSRAGMVARLVKDDCISEWALMYEFDIVLRGRDASRFEDDHA